MSLFSIFKRTPVSTQSKEPTVIKPAFTFNSKETYLAYRADWKDRYFAGCKAVRTARQEVRNANRAYSKDNKTIGDIWSAYGDLRKAREDVVKLQTELNDARAEAGRQMRAHTTV